MKNSAVRAAAILAVFLSSAISAEESNYSLTPLLKSGACRITLTKDEKALKEFNGKDLGIKAQENCEFTEQLPASDGNVWISTGATAGIDAIAKINPKTFQVTVFDLSGLGIHSKEFAKNPLKEMIAFSDYPLIFDVESADALLKKKFSLFVYDLKTKKKQTIAASVGKDFSPAWTDEKTLEYNNPKGNGRNKKTVP